MKFEGRCTFIPFDEALLRVSLAFPEHIKRWVTGEVFICGYNKKIFDIRLCFGPARYGFKSTNYRYEGDVIEIIPYRKQQSLVVLPQKVFDLIVDEKFPV